MTPWSGKPRRWQEQALPVWLERRRGVISVVTGGGKTSFALMAYDAVRQQRPDLRLVVVVPTLALLDQWAVAIPDQLSVSSDQIGLFSGESRRTKPLTVNVVVLNTARRLSSDLVSPGPCMFVVDECHRAGSPENAKALDVDAEFRLGLSATPAREYDDGFERFVRPVLGPVIYEYDLTAARRDGIVPEIELRNYRFNLSPSEQSEHDRLSAQIARALAQDQIDDDRLRRLLIRRASVSAMSPKRVVAAVAITEALPNKRLVFHERIQRANQIATQLDRRGDRVGVYHSELAPTLRRRNLELFRRGQIRTLVTCRALDEGLDVPDAGSAVIAASTRSTRQRIQRLGRVLRPAPGKGRAIISTLFATDSEAERLASEAEALEDVASVKWFEVN